jgi:acyl carrier protein
MSADTRLEEFTALFRKLMDDPSISLTRHLAAKDVAGWDSLFNVSLIVAVERHFQIKIFLGELDKLRSVGDLVDLIDRKVEARARR